MPVDTPKYKDAEAMLPEELKPVFRRLVEEYEFLTHVNLGRSYAAYKVLADLVLAGWRPSGPSHPDSKI